MDLKPLIYHPNRTMEIYRRPDLLLAAAERDAAVAQDPKARMLAVLEMPKIDWDRLSKVALERGLDWDPGAEAYHVEAAYRDFYRHGRQIFDLSRLAEPFKHTDVDAITPGDVPLPYGALYLHFGACGLSSPFADSPVEGCYVERDAHVRDALVLTIVCRHPDLLGLRSQSLEDLMLQFGRGYVFDVKLDQPVSTGLEIDGGEDEDLWRPFVPPVVNLAINSLCYLAYPDRDVERDYQVDAPERLVRKTRSPNQKERGRAESKLSSLGYTRINFCGRRTFPESGVAYGEHGSPQPHWRRGHWRNQAHGPGRQDRKLMLIAPTMVRPDIGEPVGGHIYDVAPVEAAKR